MRKINLKAKNLSDDKDKKAYSGQVSLVVGIVSLTLAAALYGGVFYMKSNQNKKNEVIKENIQVLKNGLDNNKEYKKLYDFQDRLLELKNVANNKVVQVNLLEQISETTMAEGVLQNLKIAMDNGLSQVKLTTQITDLNILAKQLDAYDQVDVNKQATLKSSSLKGDGIEASVEFSIKSSVGR